MRLMAGLGLGLTMLFIWVLPLHALPNVQLVDPPLKNHIGWNLKGNGLLYISYDLNGNGRADYHTLHFILKAYLTSEPVRHIPGYNGGAPVFFVRYGRAHQVYVISRKALFYAIDFDEDGNWDLMYKDIQEDGVNGNEMYYDSPSNMYGVSPAEMPDNLE